LLADPAVNALYVPLPNSMHLEWAIRAAEAGRPGLLEKPLALNADDRENCRSVRATPSAADGKLHMYRLHPQHMRVRELIDSGTIGDVVEWAAT
jgi:D-xylose 1-dehydrogenase (NADP+, D-xylono-1,5-lactone-forming)